ncbi:MAG: hypothetical protein RPT25_06560 [Cycloclasticus sp.]|jgi:hypothetical protein
MQNKVLLEASEEELEAFISLARRLGHKEALEVSNDSQQAAVLLNWLHTITPQLFAQVK